VNVLHERPPMYTNVPPCTFVEAVLNSAAEAMAKKYRLKAEGYTFQSIAERVGKIFDIPDRDLMAPGKQAYRVKARSVLAYWAVHELGMSVTDVGLKLGLSQPAAGRAVERGRCIAEESKFYLEIALNA
jgi:putative transposase